MLPVGSQFPNVALAALGLLGSPQRNAIDSAVVSLAIPTNSGTPTLDGYQVALGSLEGVTLDRAMVLVTDGPPTYAENCVGYGVMLEDLAALTALTDPLVAAIRTAYGSAGIRTFVVGLPGSETGPSGTDARAWLSQAARAGDTILDPTRSDAGPTYCHFDLTGSTDLGRDLASALRDIQRAVLGCRYPVPTGGIADPDLINVPRPATGPSTCWSRTPRVHANWAGGSLTPAPPRWKSAARSATRSIRSTQQPVWTSRRMSALSRVVVIDLG